jgi:hypothetical protein
MDKTVTLNLDSVQPKNYPIKVWFKLPKSFYYDNECQAMIFE